MPLVPVHHPVLDHDSAIIALFGSYEKYRNSPLLKEINERVHYLTDLKSIIRRTMEKEHKEIPWWDIFNKGVSLIAFRVFLPSFNKDVDKLILRYGVMRPLPVKFFLNELNNEFGVFYQQHKKMFDRLGIKEYRYDHQ